MSLWIPRAIDDYNHWMCGVDLADQKISYYHPDLRCSRNWIPMFIQLLSMIRLNSYIVYLDSFPFSATKRCGYLTHKEFTMEWVKMLLLKARRHKQVEDRNEHKERQTKTPRRKKRQVQSPSTMDAIREHVETSPPIKKRSRAFKISLKNKPTLPEKRFDEPKHLHVRSKLKDVTSRPACVMCKFIWNCKEYYQEPHDQWNKEVSRTNLGCQYCDVPLCKSHFDAYHNMKIPAW